VDIQTQQRIAENESRYRDLNERQVDAEREFQDAGLPETLEIVCECALTTCDGSIAVPRQDYERVRAEPTHFLVLPEHVVAGAETVLRDEGAFWVVAKIEAGADVAKERA
jgi:hypothetical protein